MKNLKLFQCFKIFLVNIKVLVQMLVLFAAMLNKYIQTGLWFQTGGAFHIFHSMRALER